MNINIYGQDIYYQKLGKSLPAGRQGPDLILLHGWGQDSSTWWGAVQPLREDFTLWLLDLPGFGRSDNPKKPFTVSDYSNIVSEFIKKQGIKKPILLGHSLGGRIAIKLAYQQKSHLFESEPDGLLPQSRRPWGGISKLILESSAGLKHTQSLFRLLVYPFVKFFNLLPNFLNIKQKLRYKFYKLIGSDYFYADSLKETFINLIEEDLTDDLKEIETETLILAGEHDKTVPTSDSKKMHQLIKNSRLEVIDNIGHFPHIENPEMFIYWVKQFCL